MIQTEATKGESTKAIRKREKEAKEAELKKLCEELAVSKFTKEQLAKWSNQHKGLWYLPVLEENGSIKLMILMRPITRSILSYASTKIEEEGLYEFLEAAMRECYVAGDMAVIEDDEYFIPASQQFNKILKGYEAALLKR